VLGGDAVEQVGAQGSDPGVHLAQVSCCLFRPPESLLVLEEDWLASFRRAWACCIAFTPAHVCSTRPCLDPEVHTDPGPVPVLRAGRRWCNWAETPVMATTQRPRGPEHRGELAGVLVKPKHAELREPEAPWTGCPHG
jgi:hypothetical protein